MAQVFEDKIAAGIEERDSYNVYRTINVTALPQEWDNIKITNNVENNPTLIKYYLDSTFLLKLTLTYAVDNKTIVEITSSTTEE